MRHRLAFPVDEHVVGVVSYEDAVPVGAFQPVKSRSSMPWRLADTWSSLMWSRFLVGAAEFAADFRVTVRTIVAGSPGQRCFGFYVEGDVVADAHAPRLFFQFGDDSELVSG